MPDEQIQDLDSGRKVEVVDHDPTWPQTYAVEAAKIRAALGAAALSLEHVGSTAAPGLAAKPVIDIHLAVADSADEAAYRQALEGAGYRFQHAAPDWFEHRLFKGLDPEVNLHVFSTGCPELDRCKTFRDWLRRSPDDVALYAAAKRELARRNWTHVNDYAMAKSAVVRAIMERAQPASVTD